MKTPAAPPEPTFCARSVTRQDSLGPIRFLPASVATFLRRQVTTSLPVGMSTFPSQVSDLTLFNPFYLRNIHPRSTSFQRKSAVIPPIPLNSTYAVPRNDIFLTNAKMSTFPSQVPATTNFDHLRLDCRSLNAILPP